MKEKKLHPHSFNPVAYDRYYKAHTQPKPIKISPLSLHIMFTSYLLETSIQNLDTYIDWKKNSNKS